MSDRALHEALKRKQRFAEGGSVDDADGSTLKPQEPSWFSEKTPQPTAASASSDGSQQITPGTSNSAGSGGGKTYGDAFNKAQGGPDGGFKVAPIDLLSTAYSPKLPGLQSQQEVANDREKALAGFIQALATVRAANQGGRRA
jgi:hypothetical protein